MVAIEEIISDLKFIDWYKSGLLIATGQDALLIGELQPEGKKRLTVEAFLCGHSIPIGSRFSSHQES